MSSIIRSTRSRLAERQAYVYRIDVAASLTGTVTTNGTTAVTGSSTTFTSDYAAGDLIQIAGESPNTVASVTSDTALVLSVAATTSGSGKTHTGAQGLFEYFGGIIGAGSIGSPTIPSKIKVMPLAMSNPSKAIATIQAPELHIFAPHGSSGMFKPLPSGFSAPIYELLIRAYFKTETLPIVAGGLTTEDVWGHIRYVTMTGENARVPGKLLDPDATTTELNINIPEMLELTPQGKGDITIMEMMIGYQCREAIRTGATT